MRSVFDQRTAPTAPSPPDAPPQVSGPEIPKVVPLPGTGMMFGSPMDAIQTLPRRHRTAVGVGLLFSLAASLPAMTRAPRSGPPLGAHVVAASSIPAPALPSATSQEERPDQVFRRRRGDVVKVIGTVLESSLETVRLDRDGKEVSYPASEVVRIVWGSVPDSYHEARTFLSRGDYENAVARFRSAASDSSARDVVRADARLQAAETLLAWAASDPSRYNEAAAEADRFLTDYPQDRNLPRAQWLRGRALLLSGDAAAAAQTFRSLYEQGTGDPPTPGYDRLLSLEAGLACARASLAAGQVDAARELYGVLEGAFRELAQASEDDPVALAKLLEGQGEAAVGEGWCLLTEGKFDQARRAFERNVDRAELGAGGRFSARLGLAEALFSKGELRPAQFAFAQVSALDYTSRDRVGEALVGLARTTLELADPEAKASARRWLELARDSFGDTPAAAKAIEMLAGL